MVAVRVAWLLAFCGARMPQEDEVRIEHYGSRSGLPPAVALPKAEGCLRVIVGGGLQAGAWPAGVQAEGLEMAASDAVSVGYEDLEVQSPGVRELLASPKIPFVCANVKGAGRPYVIRRVRGLRVCLIGITKVPAHAKARQAPEGWTIEDPAVALKPLLREAAKEADVMILLAVMDRIECADLLRQFPEIALALVPTSGGNDPEPLPVGSASLVQSPAAGTTVGRLEVTFDGKRPAKVKNRLEPVELPPEARERLRGLYSRHKAEVEPARLVAGAGRVPQPGSVPLTSLEPGKTHPVGLVRSDRSVEVEMHSLRASASQGGRKAAAGNLWLILDSEWKNTIPMTFVFERQVPTTYLVSDATDNLYLVVNGKSLARPDAELSSGSGGLLDRKSILLETLGSRRRGHLVFPIPSAGIETLELRFYDFRHGHMFFPLLVRPGGSAPEMRPIVPLVKSEILEVGIFGMIREKRGAPEGMTTVIVDLRARSLATVEADATAFDPKAKPGEKARIGIAGDIQDAWRGLRLVADGGRESAPEESSRLPGTPRFLPEAMTGWDVAFLVPEKAANLELRWSFPDIGMPDGRVVKPAPLAIPLAGRLEAGKRLCPRCAKAAGPQDKFCGECGTKIGP